MQPTAQAVGDIAKTESAPEGRKKLTPDIAAFVVAEGLGDQFAHRADSPSEDGKEGCPVLFQHERAEVSHWQCVLKCSVGGTSRFS